MLGTVLKYRVACIPRNGSPPKHNQNKYSNNIWSNICTINTYRKVDSNIHVHLTIISRAQVVHEHELTGNEERRADRARDGYQVMIIATRESCFKYQSSVNTLYNSRIIIHSSKLQNNRLRSQPETFLFGVVSMFQFVNQTPEFCMNVSVYFKFIIT